MIYHPEKQNFAVRPDDKRLRPRIRRPTPLKKSRRKVRELKAAIRILIGNKWSEYQWKGELHEEGCSGVRTPPHLREPGWECKCDGDELARIVMRALR